MINNIITIFLIFFFAVLIAVLVWSCFQINRIGLLGAFFRAHILSSIVSGIFVVLFLTAGIGMLAGADWAVLVMRNTIYGWLVYLWVYGLNEIVKYVNLLREKEVTRFSQFMGRSRFFDEIMEKSIALSKEYHGAPPAEPGEPHAVTDSSFEALLDDEELFKEIFPYGVRRRIRRKVIGLVVWTVLFGLILWGLG